MPEWFVSPNSAFWLWADRISIILSYIVLGTIGGFILNTLRYRSKRKEMVNIAGRTLRPQALALAFGGGSIRKAVEEHLQHIYPGSQIPVEVYQAEEITAENIHKHEEAIRRLKERFQSENVTELHLFMKGPVALALAVGAIFDNWVTIKIYHSKREGGYEPWTTLHHAKAASITDELAERVTQLVDVKAQSH
jgi:hypothetical protein